MQVLVRVEMKLMFIRVLSPEIFALTDSLQDLYLEGVDDNIYCITNNGAAMHLNSCMFA